VFDCPLLTTILETSGEFLNDPILLFSELDQDQSAIGTGRLTIVGNGDFLVSEDLETPVVWSYNLFS
jgi:hypothetical protein